MKTDSDPIAVVRHFLTDRAMYKVQVSYRRPPKREPPPENWKSLVEYVKRIDILWVDEVDVFRGTSADDQDDLLRRLHELQDMEKEDRIPIEKETENEEQMFMVSSLTDFEQLLKVPMTRE